MNKRKVQNVVTGVKTQDGAGVKLTRVLWRKTVEEFDPFLMLDAFDSEDPADYTNGFPWHPHRGIETITYLIKGKIEHGDSLGNEGVINDGCCQWMTAGSGILHQEMPKASERMLGVQLWLNLPAKDKMVAPQYNDILSEQVPAIRESNGAVTVRVLSGSYLGTTGAMQARYVDLTFLDIAMSGNAKWQVVTEPEYTVFVWLVAGMAQFNGQAETYQEKQAVLFERGSQLTVQASASGLRMLMFSAKPVHEPVAWGGPIVMNTQAELDKAFQELEKGVFIKK